MNDTCLRPGCGETAVGRGLCARCYRIACALVRGKRTTWAKLVRTGRALEARPGARAQPYMKGGITAWLLRVRVPARGKFVANVALERGSRVVAGRIVERNGGRSRRRMRGSLR
jgi:hypothetical protein